ncbi:MAG: undecaprenyl-phosphate glucose phosphotransferase [Candidatus Aminicenantes bacterium]|nr:undecaprenyl-phosphate glucose phosphotransferase [Candidatus Aminicenantes bacterium]
MIKEKKIRLLTVYLIADIIAILVAYFYAYFFRFYGYIIPVDPLKGIPPLASYLAVCPLFLLVHLIIFYFQGFYRTRLKRPQIDDSFLVALNTLLTILIVMGILNYLYAYSQGAAPLFRMTFKISHGFLIVYFISVVILISFLRYQIYFFMKRRFARGLNLQNILIVGAGEMGRTLAQKLRAYKDLGFVVKGFLDDDHPVGEKIPVNGGIEVLGKISDLDEILSRGGISEVYVALELKNYSKILETLKTVHKHIVNVRLIPDVFQLLTLKANIQDLDGVPVISIDDVSLRGFNRLLKRTVDIVVSFFGLVVLSPILLIIALLIKLTSRGPIFYLQERMGLDGRQFTMIKFRTMICDAEKETGPVMCRPDDPRITPFGRFLRKYSLDELPQLINVLKGEMSLVGPRPERPSFVREFADRIPKYMLRHKVKSGITGWAQVHGLRQDTSIEKRLEYDLYYIKNWSLGLDLKIIWMTIKRGFIDPNMR